MSFELAPKDFEHVLLEFEWVSNQALQIALVDEEASLLGATAARLHLIEEERRAWVHALRDDLEPREIGDHDQVALETGGQLLGELS